MKTNPSITRHIRMATLFVFAFPITAAAQDLADEAWRSGDTRTAERLYAERLAADSADEQALHRMALMRGWEGRFDEGVALFDRLLSISPANGEARVDRARLLAWRGDTKDAIDAVRIVLEDDPENRAAWRALAQFQSWDRRYDEALATLETAARVWPNDRALARQRARVLGEAGRLEESVAAYESLASSDSGDLEARLGLARVLAWSDRLDASAAQYDSVLERWPDNAEALAGRARVASWSGDLIEGETRWRRAVAAHPEQVSFLVGLGQTLRWQGRDAAAREALAAAAGMQPENSDLRAELQLLNAALRPFAAPSLSYQTDSDGNRILTFSVAGGWSPTPAVSVRATAYGRSARQVGALDFTEGTGGLMAEVGVYIDPGWIVTGGLGASGSGTAGTGAIAAGKARITTPERHSLSGSIGFFAHALDETALLIRNNVKFAQLDADFRYSPAPGWRVGGGAGVSRFDGSESNRRVNGWADALRRLSSSWSVGVTARSFGFEKNLNDGYFDPSFYLLAQVPVAWTRPLGHWRASVQLAPGLQHVAGTGGPRGALGATAELQYGFGPGREISVWGGYSSTGMASFSSGSADYRYGTFGVRGSWAF